MSLTPWLRAGRTRVYSQLQLYEVGKSSDGMPTSTVAISVETYDFVFGLAN